MSYITYINIGTTWHPVWERVEVIFSGSTITKKKNQKETM